MARLGRAHEDEAVVRVVRHHLVHLRLRALLELAARREAVDDHARHVAAHVEAQVLEGGLGDHHALRHAQGAEQLGEDACEEGAGAASGRAAGGRRGQAGGGRAVPKRAAGGRAKPPSLIPKRAGP